MQPLTAHPDKRVRGSRPLRGTEELAPPIIGETRNGVVRRVLMFLSMLGFSFAALLVVVGGGREAWLDKAERGATQLLVTLSNEFGLVVKTITISGNETVTSEVFLDTLGILVGDSMALADLGGALARLSKLEWVDQVGVSRNWPNEVIVAVREKKPVAVWESSDGRVLIDKDGYSCGNRYIDRFSQLPIIIGMGGQEAFPRLLRILNTNSYVKSSVKRAVLVGSRRWDLQMKENLVVRLPEVALEKAWAKFTEHFEKDYLSLVGAVVADYTLADRLILVLDINSGRESHDNLVRRPTLETIIKADQNQALHEIVPVKLL